MKHVLLIQLPIPQLNYGRQTGDVPLGSACLKQAANRLTDVTVEVLPESLSAYLGDAALLQRILERQPDIVGFSVFCWNLDRTLAFAREIKSRLGAKIIFGGPEITPDNPALASAPADFFVIGEGEAVFLRLLQDPDFWSRKSASLPSDTIFQASPSPYIGDLLEPGIENTVLLETQRGCPYRCGYCYYNKSRGNLAFVDETLLISAIQWSVDRGIGELYLLDPSLNARRGLKPLLKQIAEINRDRRISMISEIRAEAIDEELADLLAAAGFTWFEIGLQSITSRALEIMNRPTDLDRFVRGAKRLRDRGIRTGIDLIIGLPGDNLDGFKRSVDFLVDHGLSDDIQAFPLSILPGTAFRQRHIELGLTYDPQPPYTLIEAADFSADDMLMALDYAETRFDTAIFPLPDLDVSFRTGAAESVDIEVKLGNRAYVTKIMLSAERRSPELAAVAKRLTQPYQVFIGPAIRHRAAIENALEILSRANPFTPLEIVFLEPETHPDTRALLSAIRLDRPHYLDNDLRFLFARPGNRAVLFTLVSRDPRPRFSGDMERQVLWWTAPRLPSLSELENINELDGVLIDSSGPEAELTRWQDDMATHAEAIPFISFARCDLQHRWQRLTASGDYWFGAFAKTGLTI